ncbi:ODV-E28 [Plodia interpunctella granulovirus]|uniref:ODV-E28 n=1 Tax=Plodia interpunctella granulovirus TaxID=262175 RepID=A0A1L5JHG8_9BBAC|nr:ODV-E28 [Plodia interpunctella granulovirus]APO13960.1 ODV-E28 [Plodia interpunctella granulovirus]
MSLIDIFTAILLCVSLLILTLITFSNPLIMVGQRLIDAAQINVGSFIRVFERDGDRLFVIEPEGVLLYNTRGILYYYFEGGSSKRLCPNGEQAVVRISNSDIRLVNETGTYNITCTHTRSSNLYNHFRNDSLHWDTPLFSAHFTIIDIINYVIGEGYADLSR